MRTKQAACLRTQVLQMSPARVLTTGCLEGRFGARDLSQRRWLHLDLATAAVYKRHSRKVPALSRRNFHEDASVAKLVKAAHPRLVDVSRHDPTRKAGSSRTGRRCADGQTAGVAARCRCFTCLCASSIETRRLKDRSLRGAYWRRRKQCAEPEAVRSRAEAVRRTGPLRMRADALLLCQPGIERGNVDFGPPCAASTAMNMCIVNEAIARVDPADGVRIWLSEGSGHSNPNLPTSVRRAHRCGSGQVVSAVGVQVRPGMHSRYPHPRLPATMRCDSDAKIAIDRYASRCDPWKR